MHGKDEVVAAERLHAPSKPQIFVAAVLALQEAWRYDRDEEGSLAERAFDRLGPIRAIGNRGDILPDHDFDAALQHDRPADDCAQLAQLSVAMRVVLTGVAPESHRIEHSALRLPSARSVRASIHVHRPLFNPRAPAIGSPT